jgi:dienelactone hydrolase
MHPLLRFPALALVLFELGAAPDARAAEGVAQAASAGAREGLVEERISIPVAFKGFFGDSTGELKALVVRPADAGKHPLALLSHGSPRSGDARVRVTTETMAPQAREFARRGWVAVTLVRRGYGETGGSWAEDWGKCSSPHYDEAGLTSAQDLAGAIPFLAKLPYVESDRILAVGVSAGGFASVALSSMNVPGLIGVINFAGGRGSKGPNDVCDASSLSRAMGKYGAAARVPQLWVYSTNDLFFGPSVARAMHAAFTAAGGKAEFIEAPPYGDDGHHLFNARGTSIWSPMVDAFLRRQNL